ncbi:MAG: glycosyl transferase [Candidatus Eiseniibacteriota bacterium]
MSTSEAFTSTNLNYLAKARVLGHSLRRHHPEIRLHLMLADAVPEWLDLSREPFDSVLRIEDLGIDRWKSWAFGHSVVELCTAVKPFAFRRLFETRDAQRFFYFDPDVVFFSRCDRLFDRLDGASIVMTPHVSEPDRNPSGVVDNEISSMAHGIYNLGFLGLRRDEAGRRLVEWWCDRLMLFCHDDIPRGLFTDQRWMDFVPAFFEDCRIVRDPEFNVATWNYSTRAISGSRAEGFRVDGRPLGFHHYSGVDNGASRMMLEKYAQDVPAAWDLDAWYREESAKHGQDEMAAIPWRFGYFENGEKIEQKQRILYRRRRDLQEAFPDPFAVAPGENGVGCYRDWLRRPENAEQVLLLDEKRPPFAEFLRDNFRLMKVYVRGTPRLGARGKRVLAWAMDAAAALCRWAGKLTGIG